MSPVSKQQKKKKKKFNVSIIPRLFHFNWNFKKSNNHYFSKRGIVRFR